MTSLGQTNTTTEITPADGWIGISTTWIRTGNFSFILAGDGTLQYQKGTKIRYRDGGSNEYGVVASSSFSSGTTTTVTLITNSNYAMAAATISGTYISHSESPEGWPGAFNWSPSRTGFSSNPSGTVYQWTSMGNNVLKLDISEVFSGVSNANTNKISLPVNSKNVTNGGWSGPASGVDNGSLLTAAAWAFIDVGSSTVDFYTNWAGSLWTASGGKRINKSMIMYDF